MQPENRRPVILLAFANDRDPRLRNLGKEQHDILAALEPAEHDGLCQVKLIPEATVDDVFQAFLNPDYRDRIAVFHFGGHADDYHLLLASAGSRPEAAYASGLAGFLRQQRGLQLVFLNACSTGPQARGLLDAGVAAVIATSQAIKDEAATEFAAWFYRSLGCSGATIRRAFNEAVEALKTSREGDTRAFFRADVPLVDRSPWELYPEGEEMASGWSLPEAAGNPLAGLPPLPERDLPKCPYLKPLDRYTAKEAEVFFGRGYQVRELYERVIDRHGASVILLYGQSGVGKSSLLDAGLLPRLAADVYETRYVRRDQQKGLLETLRNRLLPAGENWSLNAAWRSVEGRLGRPLVVILDQVEEAFTRHDPAHPAELEEFFAALREALGDQDNRPKGKLILSFRKEWLAELEKRLSGARLPTPAEVFLEPLDRRGIAEAVVGPSRPGRLNRQYGLEVEEDLAEVIADDLRADPGSPLAPTLQVLLCKMWEQARERDPDRTHPRFDRELYQALSRQGLLLKDFLDQQLAELGQWCPEVVNSGLALDLLEYHTTPLGTARERTFKELREDYGHLKEVVRPLVPTENYGHLDEVVRPLVQRCVDLYLLTSVSRDGEGERRATRLAHDTLAPLVRELFQTSVAPGQRARRLLENRAVGWEGDSNGEVLSPADLATVEAGKSGMRDWTPAQKKLVESSKEIHDRMSLARRLAAFSQQSRSGKPQLSLLLAVEAVVAARGHDKSERVPAAVEQALWDALSSMKFQGCPVPEDEVSPPIHVLVLMADDKLFTANLDYTLTCWDLNRLKPTYNFGEREFTSAMASGGDKHLATGTYDGWVRIWDPDQCQQKQELENVQAGSGISALSFGCDGNYLAAGCSDGTVAVWNLKQDHYRLLFNRKMHARQISSLLFTNQGLVSGSYDRTFVVWKLDKNPGTTMVEPHQEGINALALTREGNYLITGSFDRTATVWDLREEIKEHTKPMMTLKGHTGGINALDLSPDGRYLVTAGDDCIARVWNLEKITRSNHEKTETEVSDFNLYGHEGSIGSLAFTKDDKDNRLITGSKDRTARVWDLNKPDEPPLVLPGHEGAVQFIALTQDDRRLITAPKDGVARVWYLELDQLIKLAARKANRKLSAVEWRTYFGREPDPKTFPDREEEGEGGADAIEEGRMGSDQSPAAGAAGTP